MPPTAVREELSKSDLAAMTSSIANMKRMSAALVDSYLGTLRRIAENVPHSVMVEQIGIVRNQLESRGMVLYIAYIGAIELHLRAAQLGRIATLESVSADLAAAAEAPVNRRNP